MYLKFYGLKLSPFRLEPDPDFLWLSEKHLEGLAALQYAILEDKGFLLLTGDVGAGKTVLVHHLRKVLADRIRIAVLSSPGFEITDFYRLLAAELGMGDGFAGKADFLIRFRKSAADGLYPLPQRLIVLDEAHRLSHEMLDEIRVLSEIEFKDRSRLSVFLVGQEELQELLTQERNRAILQRIAVRYHLSPLDENETRSYIRHRLGVAGCDKELFSLGAAAAIYRFSRGIPRLINSICDRSLLTGYLREQPRIPAGIVNECAGELEITALPAGTAAPALEEAPPATAPLQAQKTDKPSRLPPWLWLLVVPLLAALALILISKGDFHTEKPFATESADPQSDALK